jgi:hypothetical protein
LAFTGGWPGLTSDNRYVTRVDPDYLAAAALVLAILLTAAVPIPADAVEQPTRPVVHTVIHGRHPAAIHWPGHEDPRHIEVDEPPEFVRPFVGQQRPIRAQFVPPRRGWVGKTTVAGGIFAPPPPPPQPPRRPIRAQYLPPSRGRIFPAS